MSGVRLKSLSAAALLLSLAAAGIAAAEGDQKLALVNVSLVFEKYDRVAEVQRRIDAKHRPQKEELEKTAGELSERNKGLSQYYNKPRIDEAVFDMIQRLRKDQFRFERQAENLGQEIQKDYTREMREVLTDIRMAVRSIAEKGGYEMVLRSPDTDDPESAEGGPENPASPAEADRRTYLELVAPKTYSQVVARFNRNPVLFGARAVDITQDVLKKLNEDFQRRSLGGAAGIKKP